MLHDNYPGHIEMGRVTYFVDESLSFACVRAGYHARDLCRILHVYRSRPALNTSNNALPNYCRKELAELVNPHTSTV